MADLIGEKAVRSVHADSEGRLWVGSQTGLEIFEGRRRWQPNRGSKVTSEAPWNADIVAIASDKSKNVFVLTANSGLFGFDVNDENLQPIEIALMDGASALAVGEGGKLWVAHGASVQILWVNQETRHLVRRQRFRMQGKVTTGFSFDRKGRVCFGRVGAIQCRDESGSWEIVVEKGKWLHQSTPLSVSRDRDDRLVIGLSSGAIVVLDATYSTSPANTWKICSNQPCRITAVQPVGTGFIVGSDSGLYLLEPSGQIQLLAPEIHVTAVDIDGKDVWISTYSGLHAYGASGFQTFNADTHDVNSEVLTFSEFPNGAVLVGTYGGAYIFHPHVLEGHRFVKLSVKGSPSFSKIMTSARLGQKIVAAERNYGLAVFSAPTSKAQIIYQQKDFGAPFTVLSSVSKNKIYGGTASGDLFTLATNGDHIELDRVSDANIDFESPITSITPLSDDKLLVTSERKALILCLAANFICGGIQPPASSAATRILSSAIMRDGTILLGFQNGGVWISDRNYDPTNEKIHFSSLSKPTLSESSVYAIVEIGPTVWLSTSTGIYELHLASEALRRFTKYDGLQGNDFNFGASLLHSSGYLYFGGSNGFNRFMPEEVQHKSLKIQSFISRVEIGPERHHLTRRSAKKSSVFLRSTDKYLNFQFFTDHYFENPAAAVRYKLSGFDTKWVFSKPNSEATYTSLPPGNYRFEVQAKSPDGSWEKGGASLNVDVAGPAWRSAPALGLYVLLLAALTIVSRHYYATIVVSHRANQLAREMTATAEQAMEDMQEEVETQSRLLENITKTNVATLSWISEVVEQQAESLPDVLSSEMAKVSLERIEAFMCLEHTLRYRDDRVLADLRSFTDECSSMLLARRRRGTTVTLINEVSDTLVDAEHGARLATVVYELLANALDHAFVGRDHGNFLRLAFELEPDPAAKVITAIVIAEDNGIGLPAEVSLEEYETSGFSLIRAVTRHYGGRLEHNTERGGTSLRVELPLPEDAVA
ncbi:MAG: triple tyrosine motif-containing protein [Pseudohaliea sp.]